MEAHGNRRRETRPRSRAARRGSSRDGGIGGGRRDKRRARAGCTMGRFRATSARADYAHCPSFTRMSAYALSFLRSTTQLPPRRHTYPLPGCVTMQTCGETRRALYGGLWLQGGELARGRRAICRWRSHTFQAPANREQPIPVDEVVDHLSRLGCVARCWRSIMPDQRVT